jgi:transaldolase
MTQIFLDTANLKEIEEIGKWGIINGLTTNQVIFSKEKGCNFEKQAKKIIQMMYPLPVSIEGPNNLEQLVEVAEEYHSWGCLESP